MPSVDTIYLNSDDNTCVAARPLSVGTEIEAAGTRIKLAEPVPLGHKIAIKPIAKDEPVRKYGQTIGFASETIPTGGWVHSHNLAIGEFVRDYAPASETPAALQPITDRTFMGYRRTNGKAGTRNYLAIISTVNCSASVSKYVAERFDKSLLKNYPNIDGVIALKHDNGCAMQFGGLQHKILNRVMGGMAKHPNIGGDLLCNLGCETGTLGSLLEQEQLVQIDGTSNKRNSPPVFTMQEHGGTTKTVEAAVAKVAEMLPAVNDVKRIPISAGEIILATECGGSDGNSGITANPAVGVATDMLVACGGTSILSETSEIYGAEHLLTRRAVSEQVAAKLLERIEWWLWYSKVFGCELDNNPSAGNKAGGLTTIAEKSLGAVAKGGSSALVDVYEYAEPVTAKGFVVMDTPGFDPPSVTGMVAGGANVVVFTTGRGSCFGCKPSPSIKIATNTPMYEKMIDDMDINAGEVISGKPVEEVGREIFDEILAVASGKQTKSEQHGIGEEEFCPWILGPVL
ncbi:MAG: galactonate dehydratase [Planctomycetaceae bacterium]|nr:galactonate dehydratase [Planctomycetaceae bacterium]